MNGRVSAHARRAIGLLALSATAATARAHGGEVDASGVWTTWSTEPTIAGPIVLVGWAYGLGWIRVRSGHRSKTSRRDLRWFVAGWLALVIALISPLHPLGNALFSAHMIQHELLMVVAAPLLVLGRTELYLLCALPVAASSWATRTARKSGVARIWAWLNEPLVAWFVHAAALWIWHVPKWFQATLTSPVTHTAQHISFLGTAVLFWQTVFRSSRRRAAYGASILYLFTTAVHTGALGALLTFATTVWYPAYVGSTDGWGLSSLEDQQLGGLIMWVPAGLIYLIAGLILFGGWLREAERRAAPPLRSEIQA